jgi:hypothetical protein
MRLTAEHDARSQAATLVLRETPRVCRGIDLHPGDLPGARRELTDRQMQLMHERGIWVPPDK